MPFLYLLFYLLRIKLKIESRNCTQHIVTAILMRYSWRPIRTRDIINSAPSRHMVWRFYRITSTNRFPITWRRISNISDVNLDTSWASVIFRDQPSITGSGSGALFRINPVAYYSPLFVYLSPGTGSGYCSWLNCVLSGIWSPEVKLRIPRSVNNPERWPETGPSCLSTIDPEQIWKWFIRWCLVIPEETDKKQLQ